MEMQQVVKRILWALLILSLLLNAVQAWDAWRSIHIIHDQRQYINLGSKGHYQGAGS